MQASVMKTVGRVAQDSATQVCWNVPSDPAAGVRSPSFTLDNRAAHLTWAQDTVELVCRGLQPLRQDPDLSCSAIAITIPQMGGSSNLDGNVHYTKGGVPRLPADACLQVDLKR